MVLILKSGGLIARLRGVLWFSSARKRVYPQLFAEVLMIGFGGGKFKEGASFLCVDRGYGSSTVQVGVLGLVPTGGPIQIL